MYITVTSKIDDENRRKCSVMQRQITKPFLKNILSIFSD